METRDWQLRLVRRARFLRRLLPSWHRRERAFRDWYEDEVVGAVCDGRLAGSAAEERAKKLGAVRLFTERGADDEKELIRRIDRAQVAINIRAHARFSDSVFAACPALKLVSVWGTGTDNIDLVDAKQKKLIWEGVAEGKLTDKMMQNPQATIDAVITDMFTKFPGRAAG